MGDLKAARAIHLRRQLEAAAEHGAALLSALGLPRLVTGDFIQVDPVAIGDALDLAIATLDTLDGGAEAEDDDTAEAEPDDEDDGTGEPSLASPERHPSPPVIHYGGPYTALGGEDGQLRWAEGVHNDREIADEDGPIDEDELDGFGEASGHHDGEPSIGWPEDFTAKVAPTLEAGADAEHDDADTEPEIPASFVWVFGPNRREVAHHG